MELKKESIFHRRTKDFRVRHGIKLLSHLPSFCQFFSCWKSSHFYKNRRYQDLHVKAKDFHMQISQWVEFGCVNLPRWVKNNNSLCSMKFISYANYFLLKIIYTWKGSSNMFHTSCIKHLLLLPKGGPATVTGVRIKVKCENEWIFFFLIAALRLDLHVASDFYPSISSCF